MQGPAQIISTYIHAKDGNRPWLMRHAFADTAILEMDVRTDAISFPGTSSGLDAITDTLVRSFARDYENVYTFCLGPPPGPDAPEFSCDWLVAMTGKETREIRAGCGRYDWFFQRNGKGLAENLKITIEHMQVLPPEHLSAIMSWVSGLPYPWCPAGKAVATTPRLEGFADITGYVSRGK